MNMFLLINKEHDKDLIMTAEQLHDFAYELGLAEDKEKIDDLISWSEAFPLYESILKANDYTLIKEFTKPINLKDLDI